MTLAIGLSLLAAVLFGSGTAFQAHASARSRDRSRSRSVVHIASLLTVMARPLWVVGTVLDWLGSLTHVAALHFGPLTWVQPLSLSAIIFAVPAESLLQRCRPSRRQMTAAAQTAIGLVLTAVCLGHDLQSRNVSALASRAGVALAALAIGGLVLAASRCPGHRAQALLLGAAAGSAYGLSDALVRAVQVPAATHFGNLVELMGAATALVAGGVGLLLTQAALQRGRLSLSMPAQDLLALTVSIGLGAALLGEVPRLSISVGVLTAVGLALAAHGIHQLSRTFQQPNRSPHRQYPERDGLDGETADRLLLRGDDPGLHGERVGSAR
jgi:uncharacterized membrane protein